MTIPSINFPTTLDNDQNLFLVHDALRVALAEDYNPGDTIITVSGDVSIMAQFPDTGIITLTDQCSPPKLRALSFYYGIRTATTFEELELLPEYTDATKPKNLTDVTQNVMSVHHNSLKDAIIKIEQFAGKKGETPTGPLKGTLEQRITYLRNLVLTPKAWFSADKTIGLVPLTVEFTDQSFRTATDCTSHAVSHIWDFGDNTGPSIITVIESDQVPSNISNVLVNTLNTGSIKKTYTKPGIYDATLTVTNDFGSDSVMFPELITVRFQAPDLAIIDINQRSGQILTPGDPIDGPYTTTPKIRSVINSLIDIGISSGINSNTGLTFAGEVVDDTNTPIDPIQSYTWSFSDDLVHNNSSTTRALFGIGGTYDLTLRTDTKFGAYRITNYYDVFDIVENVNLWLWTYNSANQISSNEFGLLSETFKTTSLNGLALNKNDSFLTGAVNETQQKAEFNRNNGFIQRGSSSSGNNGTALLFWASGRTAIQSASDENIFMSEYNGFLDVYTTHAAISRPWNWVGLASSQNIYFAFGGVTSSFGANTSPTNQVKTEVSLFDLTVSQSTFSSSNFKNGAGELTQNEVSYNLDGLSEQGNMSVYRSAWLNDSGYFLRNQGVGAFFRIRSFYKTSGNSTEPFIDIRKLTDMPGNKTEGQLVALSQGVYFFSNSGIVSAYNPISGVWGTGGPGASSIAFRQLQDTTISGFDNANQTLLATSDGSQTAYLSFDYSSNAFIKFNESDTTFSSIGSRPLGQQWQLGIF